MDAVRLTAPTVLLPDKPLAASAPASSATAARTAAPLAAILAVASSSGPKLAAAAGRMPTHDLSDDDLADLLIPKPTQLESRRLDLTVGGLRLVGTSGIVSREAGDTAAAQKAVGAFTVAFITDDVPPFGNESRYQRAHTCCKHAAAQLATVIEQEEASHALLTHHMQGAGASTRFSAVGGSTKSTSLVKSFLATALDAVRRDADARLHLSAERYTTLCMPPAADPPLPFAVGTSTGSAAPLLRPYMSLLPLRDVSTTLRSLPADGSRALATLVRAASPFRSLSELSLDTGIAFPLLFRLASHLYRWGHVRFVSCVLEHTLFCLHPHADLTPDGPTARDFEALSTSAGVPYIEALHLFSRPRRFGQLLQEVSEPPHSIPAPRLCSMIVFLWQRRVIQQLQTCFFLIDEPPMPAAVGGADGGGDDDGGADPGMARRRLLRNLRPMLGGEHTLDEIAWHEGLERGEVEALLSHFGSCVLRIVSPAESDDEGSG